jgi:branched-chain amino acid transport system ATP-binding protein
MTSMLELVDLTSGYGDLKVLRGVSLRVEEGTVEAVLGRNGVGKTTLLSTINGLVPLWQGSIRLNGQDIGKVPAYKRSALGIATVQEGRRIFQRRTVKENVMLGTFPRKLGKQERREQCASILSQFPILASRENQQAGALSGGQQQMLAIAQALAAEPRVLLLDEPSAGLAPAIVAEVFEQVAALRARGITILLVEQLAAHALALADHVTVINEGRVVVAGPASDFDDLGEVQRAYLGTVPRSAKPVAAQPARDA